jgi:phage FluMu protein Com
MAAVRCDTCGKVWTMLGDYETDYVTPRACPYCGQTDAFTIAPGQYDLEAIEGRADIGWVQQKGEA